LSTHVESFRTWLSAPPVAERILAAPDRVRRVMVECLGLVERELPFEVLPTLRWLESEALEAPHVDGERLKEARLACWKHLEACACHGVGTEVHAVRAVLTTLETLARAPTTEELAEVLRLVSAAGAPREALAARLSGVLDAAPSGAGQAE
jgi:hypothetical protein